MAMATQGNGVTESAIMKSTAAAEATRKKAEEARHAVERAQREFEKKSKDIISAVQNGVHRTNGDTSYGGGVTLRPNANGGGHGGWNNGGGSSSSHNNRGNSSRQKMKAQDYFQKCKDWRKQNGGNRR